MQSMRGNLSRLIFRAKSAYQEIEVRETEAFGKCLFLNGEIQCSERDHDIYDKALLTQIRNDDKKLLILGGGDGYTAEMALKLNPQLQITIVELDRSVINACKTYLDQQIFEHPNINLVLADAVHFLRQPGKLSYDCAICDLTDRPLAHTGIAVSVLYLDIFSLVSKSVKRSGWISAYAGCDENIANAMIGAQCGQISKCDIVVPSFGEPCFFIYKPYNREEN